MKKRSFGIGYGLIIFLAVSLSLAQPTVSEDLSPLSSLELVGTGVSGQIKRTLFDPPNFGYLTARDLETQKVTYQSLMKLILNPNHPILEMKDLIEKLPSRCRDNFTMVFRSLSRQKSNHNNPRTLMYCDEIVLSFIGDDNLRGYPNFETIEYREDKEEFAFGDFHFPENPEDKNSLVRFAYPRPGACKRCHTSAFRPIWRPKGKWKGVYGAKNDAVVAGTEEYQKFHEGLEMWPDHKRYRHLNLKKGCSENGYLSSDPKGSPRSECQPNNGLTNLLIKTSSKRVWSKLTADPVFDDYKHLLAFLLLDCESPKIEDMINEDIEYNLFQAYKKKRSIRVIHNLPRRYAQLRKDNPNRYFAAQILGIMGVEKRIWIPARTETQFQFASGETSMGEQILNRLLRDLAESDPKMSPYYLETSNWLEPFDKKLAHRSCRYLGPVAARELIQASKIEGYAPFPEDPLAQLPIGVKRCASCHSLGYDFPPAISFHQPEVLRKELRAKARTSNRDLYSEIKIRLFSKAVGVRPMPPTEPPMHNVMKEQVVKYLDGILGQNEDIPKALPKLIQQKCLGCHRSHSKGIPAIAFDDLKKLKAQLNRKAKTSSRLLRDEIKARIQNDEVPLFMPPGNPLQDSEIAEIIEFIDRF